MIQTIFACLPKKLLFLNKDLLLLPMLEVMGVTFFCCCQNMMIWPKAHETHKSSKVVKKKPRTGPLIFVQIFLGVHFLFDTI